MTPDYEEKWDDIYNHYIKQTPSWLSKFKGKNQQDLREWLLNELSPGAKGGKRRIQNNFVEELLETSGAQRFLDDRAEVLSSLQQQAVKSELSRSAPQRLADERVTAKDLRSINKESLRSWRADPGRFDLRGVDTRTKTLLSSYISNKIREKTAAGYTVKRYNGVPGYLDKQQRVRSVLTGRFIKKT